MKKRLRKKERVRARGYQVRLNGGVFCWIANEAIDYSVCMVRQGRKPDDCYGCRHYTVR